MPRILSLLLMAFSINATAQNVGIGTTAPAARLHVADSNVLFTGQLVTPFSTIYPPPASGPGTRLMWYPERAAFRVGEVNNANWDKDNIGIYSFASGYNTKASGEAATSMGAFNDVPGIGAASIGIYNYSSGFASIALGEENTATGSGSVSMGYFNAAIGSRSTSMGNNTVASGTYATSMGGFTRASGSYATSMGGSTVAAGAYAASMGMSTLAKSDYSLAIGLHNDTSNNDRLFEIGNGAFTARHNAVTVLRNGNVGISTSAPVNRLDVEGLNNWDLTNTEGDMRIGNANYRIKMGIALDGGGAGAATIRAVGGIQQLNLGAGTSTLITMNGGTGFVGIGTASPTQKLHVAGNIVATGTITPSDSRYKKNIRPLTHALDKIESLHGVSYDYKFKEYPQMGLSESKQIGLIAQEVEKVLPEAVHVIDGNDLKGVEYTKVIPLLIEGIKEQQQLIVSQQKQIDELKKLLEDLSKK